MLERTGPPFSFFRDTSPLICKIFECISKNLSVYHNALAEYDRQASRARKAVKIAAAELLKKIWIYLILTQNAHAKVAAKYVFVAEIKIYNHLLIAF
jgi:hypothetical protein